MIDTKEIRIGIDKPRQHHGVWLTKQLVIALDEVDRLEALHEYQLREEGALRDTISILRKSGYRAG